MIIITVCPGFLSRVQRRVIVSQETSRARRSLRVAACTLTTTTTPTMRLFFINHNSHIPIIARPARAGERERERRSACFGQLLRFPPPPAPESRHAIRPTPGSPSPRRLPVPDRSRRTAVGEERDGVGGRLLADADDPTVAAAAASTFAGAR